MELGRWGLSTALAAVLLTAVAGGEVSVPDAVIVPDPPVLLTVGSDARCDYDELDFAILDSARFGSGQHTLRIARNYTGTVSVFVHNRSLYFEGGYETCSSTQRSGKTELRGDGVNQLFFLLETDNGSHEVAFDSLKLSAGGGTRGGGLDISGEGMTVLLRRSTLLDNAVVDRGGAVFVSRGRLIIDDGSTLIRNVAFQGGGVYCDGGFVDLLSGAIAFNTVEQGNNGDLARGGGVYAKGCLVHVTAGGLFGGIFGNQTVQNEAGSELAAGGIRAVDSSIVQLVGGADHPAAVDNNIGKGIVLSSGSMLARNASISGNTGIGLEVSSSGVVIDRSEDCHTSDRCSRISNNGGSGVQATGGHLTVRQSYVEGNGREGLLGLGLARLFVSNAFIARNGGEDGSQIRLSFAELDLLQSTVIGLSVFRPAITGSTPRFELRNSLLWRDRPAGQGAVVFPIAVEGPVDLNCGIFDSTSNPPGNVTGIRVFEQDPLFVDFAGGDYHLRGGSPAIDRCPILTPSIRDADFQERGVDIVGVGDPPFPDDIGADEFPVEVLIRPPLIFSDGFESGDLSRW